MAFLPHQQRVVDEKQSLDEKLSKLSEFLMTPMFSSLDKDEQHRMIDQHSVMGEYSEILRQRITAFTA
jgi:hypothetical protein